MYPSVNLFAAPVYIMNVFVWDWAHTWKYTERKTRIFISLANIAGRMRCIMLSLIPMCCCMFYLFVPCDLTPVSKDSGTLLVGYCVEVAHGCGQGLSWVCVATAVEGLYVSIQAWMDAGVFGSPGAAKEKCQPI